MFKHAGYIVQDKKGLAIYGFGPTPDDAWRMAYDGAGPFHFPNGAEMGEDHARAALFREFPATQDLIDTVDKQGGAISWSIYNGIACLDSEL